MGVLPAPPSKPRLAPLLGVARTARRRDCASQQRRNPMLVANLRELAMQTRLADAFCEGRLDGLKGD